MQIRSKVVERVARYKTDCQEMAQLLLKHRLSTDRELSEVTVLLTTQRREEIAFIMTQATETYKRMFKR